MAELGRLDLRQDPGVGGIDLVDDAHEVGPEVTEGGHSALGGLARRIAAAAAHSFAIRDREEEPQQNYQLRNGEGEVSADTLGEKAVDSVRKSENDPGFDTS